MTCPIVALIFVAPSLPRRRSPHAFLHPTFYSGPSSLMSLFDAPGWDSGNSTIAPGSSTRHRSNKRKRAPGAGVTDDSDAAPATNGAGSPNIQKLMRKLQIEQSRKNSAMERLKPSESATKALKARQKAGLPPSINLVTSMDPPSQTQLATSSPSNSPSSSTLPRSPKKRRVHREESDVLPPSSAGDDTEPTISLPKNKKRKKSKKLRNDDNDLRPGFATNKDVNSGDEDTSRPLKPVMSINESDASDEYAGLTKLQREMKQRLSGGRFRYVCLFPRSLHSCPLANLGEQNDQ